MPWRAGSPQRAKARRSCSRTAAAGTRPQVPRGEDPGPEDRAAVLIDHQKSAHLLIISDSEKHFSVPLPGLVGPGRASRVRLQPAPCRGRRSAGPHEPAVERPLRGDGPSRQPLKRLDPDQAGPQDGCSRRHFRSARATSEDAASPTGGRRSSGAIPSAPRRRNLPRRRRTVEPRNPSDATFSWDHATIPRPSAEVLQVEDGAGLGITARTRTIERKPLVSSYSSPLRPKRFTRQESAIRFKKCSSHSASSLGRFA